MKNSEPFKVDETRPRADWNGRHLKVALDRVPDPGARSFWAKIMRRLPLHGPGGPTLRPPNEKSPLRVGATGRSPVQPAASYGNRSEPPGRGQPGRCFLPRSSLPPGHNQASWNCQTLIVSRQSRGFTMRKLPLLLKRLKGGADSENFCGRIFPGGRFYPCPE